MKPQQVRTFLIALGSDPGEVFEGEEWITTHCPLAPWTHDSGKDSNPSFAIKCTPGREPWFHCFTCESGDLLKLVQLLQKYGAKTPKYNLKKALAILAEDDEDVSLDIKDFDDPARKIQPVKPWPETYLTMFKRAVDVPLAMEYLNGRGVDEGIARTLDIRWDLPREAVSFPVRDWDGRLTGLRGRRLAGGYYDYGGPFDHRNKQVWFGEHWLDTSETVVMVESVFDVASVFRVYGNVVAPLTVGMSKEKVHRMSACLDIVTLFDNGAGGDKARALIDKYLPGSIRQHLKPFAHRDDPGEMTRAELLQLLDDYVLTHAA